MELRQVEVYDFAELSDEVKEKVLNKFREQNDFPFLEDNLKEELTEKLKTNNIKEIGKITLRYSLGCSQGDGLSFIGDFEYRGFNFKIDLGLNANYYSHSRTTDINIDDTDDDGDDLRELVKQITEEDFKNMYYEICDQLEKSGYSDIEAENDDENIKENINANEYKFLANGDIF